MDFTAQMLVTNTKNKFMLHNQLKLTKMEPDYACVEVDISKHHENLYGAVHGGLFLIMADCAAGGAARTNGLQYVTVSNSFEFYRNTKNKHLIAEGRVKHRGNTLCVVEVALHDAEGETLGGGTFTLFCTGEMTYAPDEASV